MKTQDTSLIHPEDSSNIHYWAKKWRVSSSDLNNAILDTGSLNPGRIREYIKKNNWEKSVLAAVVKFFRVNHKTIN